MFQWLTHADVDVSLDRRSIRLEQADERLDLHILAPADAAIEVTDVSAPRHSYEQPNPHLKRITLTTTTPARTEGEFTIVARPGSTAPTASSVDIPPLAKWRDSVLP